MSTALAPSPWPAPATAADAAGWRFGRLVDLPGREGPRRVLQWVLKRNCSSSPRQTLAAYLALCAVSLSIALGFLVHGAPFVLAFAGLEVALVGVALFVYARHAADRETITLSERAVEVEQCFGRQVERAAFRAEWLCIEPAKAQGSLVELAGQGQRVRVGRFLRPELRSAFAQEVRQALRRAQAGLPPQESELEVQR